MRFSAFCIVIFLTTCVSVHAQERVSLEEVIGLALEQDYNIRLARNTAEVANTDEDYAWGAFLPQVNAQGSYFWTDNNQSLEFSDESRNNSGDVKSNNLSAAIQLSWTLFDGTRMFATRERISELARQGEFIVKDQITNTVASVIVNYYDIVRQKQQLRAIQEQMAVSEERVKLADRKLQVGTGGKPELLQAKVDLNAQRTQVLQQQAAIEQLKDQLNGLVAMRLPESYEVADTIIIDLNLQREQLFENIENTNYGLQAARVDLSVASLLLREVRAERYPFLNFDASYSYSNTNNIALVNPFGPVLSRTDGLNFGFTLTVPILNNFNNRRLTQQAQINITRQELLFVQQRTQVNIALQNAYVNYENAKDILLVEEENILLAKENVFIALEGFKRGITTFIELRTAQESLETAYNRLIAARYMAKLAETELLRLSGALLRG